MPKKTADEQARSSRAFDPDLITDATAKAEAEARNGLRQFDAGIGAAEQAIEQGGFRLRPSLVLALHREALRDISHYAGNYRPAGVEILGSKHQPPAAHLVPELVEDMCDYVNDNWADKTAIHLAAYVMWRLNWVHPFADGNGRTSRITSYVVLCIKVGFIPPGTHTIPDQIADNRNPYFNALDAADTAWQRGQTVDVSAMETLLSGMLAKQLKRFHDLASGEA